MVTCQSSELGWEVTVELTTDFLSLGRGSVNHYGGSFTSLCLHEYMFEMGPLMSN